MKPVILSLVCMVALSGCDTTEPPEFYIWTTNGTLIQANRVYVDAGFLAFGSSLKIPTEEGVAYVEKDLTNIKNITILPRKKPEEHPKASLQEQIDAERERRDHPKDYTPILFITCPDGRMVFGSYEIEDATLICTTPRGRLDLPLSTVQMIDYQSEEAESGPSVGFIFMLIALLVLALGISAYRFLPPFKKLPRRGKQ